MKKGLCVLFLLPLLSSAQKDFPKTWESKFQVDPRWNDYSEDLSLIFAGDLGDMEMLDGTNGKSLWVLNMKDRFGVKNCDDWFFLEEDNVVKVLYKKPKEDTQTIVFLDARSGQPVGEPVKVEKPQRSSSSKANSYSKFTFQTYLLDEPSTTMISLGYDDKVLKNGWGGSDMKITVSATGGYDWTTSFQGKVVAHICPELIESDVILNLFVAESKVFIMHEGITVLDLKTGKVLWTTTFDYTDTSVGLKAKQEIGRTAWPAVTADGVYICDLSKGEKSIKKLDINTGKVIWTGEKLSKDDIISSILVVDGTLIVKYGGVLLREQFFPSTSGGIGDGTYKVDYPFEGTTTIRAFDTANGSLRWTSDDWNNGDNFKKSPCNLIEENKKLFICSDKFFYRIDAQTGKNETRTEYGAKAIGMPQFMYFMDGRMIIEGDEGIASVDAEGKLIYATSTGKCLLTQWRGDAFIVWTGKDEDDRNEFIRFDLNKGTISGKMEDCYRPRFDTTGDSFLKFDGSKITRYSTAF